MRLLIYVLPVLALTAIFSVQFYPYGADAELAPDPVNEAYSRRVFAKARANWKLISSQRVSSTLHQTGQPVADKTFGF